MPQNIYDNPQFFDGYLDLRQTEAGLNRAVEEPALRSLLPPLEGRVAADLGCGFGNLCRDLRAGGARSVLGVDLSERMLELARERTADPAIRYERMSIEDVTFPPASFDLVTSSLALHYVDRFDHVVTHVYEALMSGGSFVFSVEHPICTAVLNTWSRSPDWIGGHWPVDNYQDEGERLSHWFVDEVVSYHRTVQTYINTVLDAGFRLRRVLEPADEHVPPDLRDRDYSSQRRRPPFLVIAADKP